MKRRRSKEVWIPMASILSSVLSRLDRRWKLPRWLPACLLAGLRCSPGKLAGSLAGWPDGWLAGWLVGCFGSRLLEKPDSSCAKLCFPSCVYVPTHAWGTILVISLHVYIRHGNRASPRNTSFYLQSAQILALR